MPIQAADSFVRFGAGHLAVIALTLLLPAAVAWAVRRAHRPSLTRAIAWSLAGLLLVNRAAALWLLWREGKLTADRCLPLDPCDISNLLAIVALLTRQRLCYELTYFWGIAGALPAVLTPDLAAAFPGPHFFVFFIGHSGVVLAAVFMTATMGLRPRWASLGRAAALMLAWLPVAGLANRLTGANYGYLSEPAPGSIQEVMGPWPWYIVGTMGLGVVLLVACYLPLAIADRLGRGRPS